jgi:glycosyltransferase involved in cell wall biosynthesis
MGIFEQSLALQERGWLGAMAIDYYCDLSRPPYSFLPDGRIRKQLRKRYHPTLDADQVHTLVLPAVAVRIATHWARLNTTSDRFVFWLNEKFDRWVAAQLPRLGNLAFGYEGASLHTFRRAKQLGMPRVLYQPIACAEKAAIILGEEKRYFPSLSDTLRYNWFPEQELEKRREERMLADAIICASEFTKKSLIEVGVDPAIVFVEPYGVNQTVFSPSDDKFPKFSVIWAGSYTQTKGIGYLLEALAREPVPGIELITAGHPHGKDALNLYEDKVRIRRRGFIGREELGKVMARCHAHVFPTLLEGFGRNIVEAMASGLPVITTANCAGPDLIEDGVTGFIVPVRDVDAICEKLAWINDHAEAALQMGRRARDRVSRLTQVDYRLRFARRIQEVWQATSGQKAY